MDRLPQEASLPPPTTAKPPLPPPKPQCPAIATAAATTAQHPETTPRQLAKHAQHGLPLTSSHSSPLLTQWKSLNCGREVGGGRQRGRVGRVELTLGARSCSRIVIWRVCCATHATPQQPSVLCQPPHLQPAAASPPTSGQASFPACSSANLGVQLDKGIPAAVKLVGQVPGLQAAVGLVLAYLAVIG